MLRTLIMMPLLFFSQMTLLAADGDLSIPVGTMATAHLANDLVIPVGKTVPVTVDVTGPLSGATGAYAKIPLRLTGTATANVSTGRITIELTATLISTITMPTKAYIIDVVDQAFGIAARVEHLAPGTAPTGAATTRPSEDLLKIAVPHLAASTGTAIQVVWMEGITIPVAALPVTTSPAAETSPETPTSPRSGRTIQIAPGPTVHQESGTP